MEQSRRLGRAASNPVLLHCTAPAAECERRYRERRGERHPCHLDDGRSSIDWDRYNVMELGIPTLLVDTTDGYRPDYPSMVAFIKSHRATRRIVSHGRPR